MWEPLFANMAVVAMTLVCWGSIGDVLVKLSPLTQRVVFGVAMAIGTIGSMTMAFEASPGVFYDMRGPLISVSCLFGGPIAAILVSGAASLYRLSMGGAVLTGIIGIAASTVVGLAGYALCRRRAMRNMDIVGLAVAVSTTGCLLVLTLPAPMRDKLLRLIWAPVSLSFVATLLLGMLLLRDLRHRELLNSNKLYRAMVDILPDCLNIKDLDGHFLAANPATAALMAAGSAEALIGKTDFDFYAPDIAGRFRDDELSVLRKGETKSIEQARERSNGSMGWLSTLKVPIRSEGGDVIGLITHNRDITVAKQLQQQLEQTQAYLDQALDNMNDGLVMFDASGVIVFCNDRYRELFPLTAHLRVSGTAFADVLRYSVACGEEKLRAGEALETYVTRKIASLRENGEKLLEIEGDRTLSCRTKILPNGYCLRMISDITERQTFERHLEHQALHDPLTGLANRALFNRELDQSLLRAKAAAGSVTIMLLDLDRFKQVNDSFGHAAGDALLVEVSRRIESAVRTGDLVARLGGDEFAVLMNDLPDDQAEIAMARRIMKGLVAPFAVGNIMLMPGATIGYTAFPRDPSDADTLLRNADSALYRAKDRGRGTWKAFSPDEPLARGATRVG